MLSDDLPDQAKKDLLDAKLSSLKIVADSIIERQKKIVNEIIVCDGRRAAARQISVAIQGIIKDRIGKLFDNGVEKDQISDEQNFANKLKTIAINAENDAFNEKLMLQGEARSLINQVNFIRKKIAEFSFEPKVVRSLEENIEKNRIPQQEQEQEQQDIKESEHKEATKNPRFFVAKKRKRKSKISITTDNKSIHGSE